MTFKKTKQEQNFDIFMKINKIGNVLAFRKKLSVIIPTLNEGERIEGTIRSVLKFVSEVIVVDGGSSDQTIFLARKTGAEVILSQRGRGTQLSLGAKTAKSEWLLILHADTVLEEGWLKEVSNFIEAKAYNQAAVFQFALKDRNKLARLIEKGVSLRCRFFFLPYGDQGLLINRNFLLELGGYRSVPIFEDVELVRRIGRKRLALLNCHAVTSARKYQETGYVFRPVRNLFLLALYFLGIPPKFLEKIYD